MNDQRKVAIVTGAGSGIGKAVALALLENGYRVAVAGRRRDALDSTVRAAGGRSSDVLPVVTDIGNPASVAALFDTVAEKLGRLDLLFNNAGTGAPAVPLEDLPVETLQAVINTNLLGAFLCTQQAIRIMLAALPIGANVYLMSRQFGVLSGAIASAIVLTTAVAALSMPVILTLIGTDAAQ